MLLAYDLQAEHQATPAHVVGETSQPPAIPEFLNEQQSGAVQDNLGEINDAHSASGVDSSEQVPSQTSNRSVSAPRSPSPTEDQPPQESPDDLDSLFEEDPKDQAFDEINGPPYAPTASAEEGSPQTTAAGMYGNGTFPTANGEGHSLFPTDIRGDLASSSSAGESNDDTPANANGEDTASIEAAIIHNLAGMAAQAYIPLADKSRSEGPADSEVEELDWESLIDLSNAGPSS